MSSGWSCNILAPTCMFVSPVDREHHRVARGTARRRERGRAPHRARSGGREADGVGGPGRGADRYRLFDLGGGRVIGITGLVGVDDAAAHGRPAGQEAISPLSAVIMAP